MSNANFIIGQGPGLSLRTVLDTIWTHRMDIINSSLIDAVVVVVVEIKTKQGRSDD